MAARQTEATQAKTFLHWVNHHLAKCNGDAIDDLRTSLKTGIALSQLLGQLASCKGPRIQSKPLTSKFVCLGNLSQCFAFIKQLGIRLENISPQDVYDGNLKLILGLIWTLINHFLIDLDDPDVGAEAGADADDGVTSVPALMPHPDLPMSAVEPAPAKRSAKGVILDWLRIIEHYPCVQADKLSSFTDGMALCALVDVHAPHALGVPFDQLDPEDKEANVQRALSALAKYWDIPVLFDATDLAMGALDIKSIITYLGLCKNNLCALDPTLAEPVDAQPDAEPATEAVPATAEAEAQQSGGDGSQKASAPCVGDAQDSDDSSGQPETAASGRKLVKQAPVMGTYDVIEASTSEDVGQPPQLLLSALDRFYDGETTPRSGHASPTPDAARRASSLMSGVDAVHATVLFQAHSDVKRLHERSRNLTVLTPAVLRRDKPATTSALSSIVTDLREVRDEAALASRSVPATQRNQLKAAMVDADQALDSLLADADAAIADPDNAIMAALVEADVTRLRTAQTRVAALTGASDVAAAEANATLVQAQEQLRLAVQATPSEPASWQPLAEAAQVAAFNLADAKRNQSVVASLPPARRAAVASALSDLEAAAVAQSEAVAAGHADRVLLAHADVADSVADVDADLALSPVEWLDVVVAEAVPRARRALVSTKAPERRERQLAHVHAVVHRALAASYERAQVMHPRLRVALLAQLDAVVRDVNYITLHGREQDGGDGADVDGGLVAAEGAEGDSDPAEGAATRAPVAAKAAPGPEDVVRLREHACEARQTLAQTEPWLSLHHKLRALAANVRHGRVADATGSWSDLQPMLDACTTTYQDAAAESPRVAQLLEEAASLRERQAHAWTEWLADDSGAEGHRRARVVAQLTMELDAVVAELERESVSCSIADELADLAELMAGLVNLGTTQDKSDANERAELRVARQQALALSAARDAARRVDRIAAEQLTAKDAAPIRSAAAELEEAVPVLVRELHAGDPTAVTRLTSDLQSHILPTLAAAVAEGQLEEDTKDSASLGVASSPDSDDDSLDVRPAARMRKAARRVKHVRRMAPSDPELQAAAEAFQGAGQSFLDYRAPPESLDVILNAEKRAAMQREMDDLLAELHSFDPRASRPVETHLQQRANVVALHTPDLHCLDDLDQVLVELQQVQSTPSDPTDMRTLRRLRDERVSRSLSSLSAEAPPLPPPRHMRDLGATDEDDDDRDYDEDNDAAAAAAELMLRQDTVVTAMLDDVAVLPMDAKCARIRTLSEQLARGEAGTVFGPPPAAAGMSPADVLEQARSTSALLLVQVKDMELSVAPLDEANSWCIMFIQWAAWVTRLQPLLIHEADRARLQEYVENVATSGSVMLDHLSALDDDPSVEHSSLFQEAVTINADHTQDIAQWLGGGRMQVLECAQLLPEGASVVEASDEGAAMKAAAEDGDGVDVVPEHDDGVDGVPVEPVDTDACGKAEAETLTDGGEGGADAAAASSSSSSSSSEGEEGEDPSYGPDHAKRLAADAEAGQLLSLATQRSATDRSAAAASKEDSTVPPPSDLSGQLGQLADVLNGSAADGSFHFDAEQFAAILNVLLTTCYGMVDMLPLPERAQDAIDMEHTLVRLAKAGADIIVTSRALMEEPGNAKRQQQRDTAVSHLTGTVVPELLAILTRITQYEPAPTALRVRDDVDAKRLRDACEALADATASVGAPSPDAAPHSADDEASAVRASVGAALQELGLHWAGVDVALQDLEEAHATALDEPSQAAVQTLVDQGCSWLEAAQGVVRAASWDAVALLRLTQARSFVAHVCESVCAHKDSRTPALAAEASQRWEQHFAEARRAGTRIAQIQGESVAKVDAVCHAMHHLASVRSTQAQVAALLQREAGAGDAAAATDASLPEVQSHVAALGQSLLALSEPWSHTVADPNADSSLEPFPCADFAQALDGVCMAVTGNLSCLPPVNRNPARAAVRAMLPVAERALAKLITWISVRESSQHERSYNGGFRDEMRTLVVLLRRLCDVVASAEPAADEGSVPTFDWSTVTNGLEAALMAQDALTAYTSKGSATWDSEGYAAALVGALRVLQLHLPEAQDAATKKAMQTCLRRLGASGKGFLLARKSGSDHSTHETPMLKQLEELVRLWRSVHQQPSPSSGASAPGADAVAQSDHSDSSAGKAVPDASAAETSTTATTTTTTAASASEAQTLPCGACDVPITSEYTTAEDVTYHPACFVCVECREALTGEYYKVKGDLYCRADFAAKFEKQCRRCDAVVTLNQPYLQANGSCFHSPHCFTCYDCAAPLDSSAFFAGPDNDVACQSHAVAS